MSLMGQERTPAQFRAMSALPPKADITGRRLDVRFVPKAVIAGRQPDTSQRANVGDRISTPK
jgi:hypothetical protein